MWYALIHSSPEILASITAIIAYAVIAVSFYFKTINKLEAKISDCVFKTTEKLKLELLQSRDKEIGRVLDLIREVREVNEKNIQSHKEQAKANVEFTFQTVSELKNQIQKSNDLMLNIILDKRREK